MKTIDSLLFRIFICMFYLLAIAAGLFPFAALIIDLGDPLGKDIFRFCALIPFALLSLAAARGLTALLEKAREPKKEA
jgi:hypothetical protein